MSIFLIAKSALQLVKTY